MGEASAAVGKGCQRSPEYTWLDGPSSHQTQLHSIMGVFAREEADAQFALGSGTSCAAGSA